MFVAIALVGLFAILSALHIAFSTPLNEKAKAGAEANVTFANFIGAMFIAQGVILIE